MLKLFIDGSCRGNGKNKSISGIGVVIYEENKKIANLSYLLPFQATNNECEYQALLYALEFLNIGFNYRQKIIIYSDSKLVVNQVNKIWKIKKYELNNLCETVRIHLNKYKCWKLQWIPRTKNKEADKLAQSITEDKNAN